MVFPNQLKKSNICGITRYSDEVMISSENLKDLDKKTSSIKIESSNLSLINLLTREELLNLKDLIKLNLKAIYLDLSKSDIQVIGQFYNNVNFNKNCNNLLDEMLESQIISEFTKKEIDINKEKYIKDILIETLIPMTYFLGILLFFENISFNEIMFDKKVRVLLNYTRIVLPTLYLENLKINQINSFFEEAFIYCLEEIKNTSQINIIPEIYSIQIIGSLLNIFSIEEVNNKIMVLIIDIIVQLFVSNALKSSLFLESVLNSVLNMIEEIPQTNKSLRKARIYIDLDFSVHVYVSLIIRLIQGVCIPNCIFFDSYETNKQNLNKYYDISRLICSHFSTFFINRLVINRTRSKDNHFSNGNDIATIIFTDIIRASLNPKYNICSTIVQIILIQLIKISNNSLLNETANSKQTSLQLESYSRELCIHILGTSLSIICGNINFSLLNKVSLEKNSNIFGNSTLNKTSKDIFICNENLNCICGDNSPIVDDESVFICSNCNKKFHYNCIIKDTHIEVFEKWKCDDCLLYSISNEINENIGANRVSESRSSNLHVILIITLEYLYRKTGLKISSTCNLSNVRKDKIITDANTSIICSYILEMISKLKLNNLNSSAKDLEISVKCSKISKLEFNTENKLYSMLLKEWFSPITKVHSPLVTYSSKFPKLLDSDTIRMWNGVVSKELKTLPDLILHCLLSNIYNSNLNSIRRSSLNSIAQVVTVSPNLILKEAIFNAIILSLRDKTPKIRERALSIIEKYFLDAFSSNKYDNQSFENDSKLFFDQILRSAYDISPLVRMASIKVLKTIYLKFPSKTNIAVVLLKRAFSDDETCTIKKLIFEIFVSLWFHTNSQVNEDMANYLIQVISYSESKEFNQFIKNEYRDSNCFMSGILSFLQNFQSNLLIKDLIARWADILIDMFLNNNKTIAVEEVNNENQKLNFLLDNSQNLGKPIFTEKKLQILKAIEIIGQIYPNSIENIYPHIFVYLKDFNDIKAEVMIRICKIISYVLPFVQALDIKSIELDLLKIAMDSKSPQLIRSSILCLSGIIKQKENDKYINENNIFMPIILDSIQVLWLYKTEIKLNKNKLEIKELDLIRRNAWLLGCIYEFNSPNLFIAIVNNKLERVRAIETEFGISWILWKENNLIKCEINEDERDIEYNVFNSSDVIFELFCELFYLLDWNLNKSLLFPTIIQFLINQKQFIKTIKFSNIIKSAIKGIQFNDENSLTILNTSKDTEKSILCIICLQGILSLLKNYEFKANEENKNSSDFENFLSKKDLFNADEHQFNFLNDTYNQNDDISHLNLFNTPNSRGRTARHLEINESTSPISSSNFSNMDNISSIRTTFFHSASQNTTSASASQPLASNLDLLLSVLQEVTVKDETRFTNNQKQQVSSLILCILEQFNKQGLVNPTSIIPPISGLLFSTNKDISFKSYKIISSLFDKFPNLIINKYKEITIYGFIFYFSTFENFLGFYEDNDKDQCFKFIFDDETIQNKVQEKTRSEILEITFEYYSRIYAEKCRNKKIYRESVIKGFCKQLEMLLSGDEIGELLKKLKPYCNLNEKILLTLYAEFLTYIILALPYIYESEILLILYNLGEICVRCSQCYSQDSDFNDLKEESEGSNDIKTYGNVILAITCTCLQILLKQEYKVSENHISKFNPYNSHLKEKPKYSHFENEFISINYENLANFITLNRSTLYSNMQFFRKKLNNIWKLSQIDGSKDELISFMNDTLYSYAHITAEKVSRPVKKRQVRKINRKRIRNKSDFDSDNSSLELDSEKKNAAS